MNGPKLTTYQLADLLFRRDGGGVLLSLCREEEAEYVTESGDFLRFAPCDPETRGRVRAQAESWRLRTPVSYTHLMIVLRTPKGWTGPKMVDGNVLEGSWRAHQVPISMGPDTEKHLPELEEWLRSYKPEELFDEDGRPVQLIRSFPPKGNRRMRCV